MGREARLPRGLNARLGVVVGKPTRAEFDALVAPYFKIDKASMKALAVASRVTK